MAITVSFPGRLVAEPKKFTNEDGSKARLLFTVAHNTKWAKGERADFIPCVMWGDERVPKLQPWMLKGRLVWVQGVLITRNVRDDDGNFIRKDFEIVVNGLEFLDKKPDIEVQPSQEQQQPIAGGTQQAAILQLMQQMMQTFAGGTQPATQPTAQPAATKPQPVPEAEPATMTIEQEPPF